MTTIINSSEINQFNQLNPRKACYYCSASKIKCKKRRIGEKCVRCWKSKRICFFIISKYKATKACDNCHAKKTGCKKEKDDLKCEKCDELEIDCTFNRESKKAGRPRNTPPPPPEPSPQINTQFQQKNSEHSNETTLSPRLEATRHVNPLEINHQNLLIPLILLKQTFQRQLCQIKAQKNELICRLQELQSNEMAICQRLESVRHALYPSYLNHHLIFMTGLQRQLHQIKAQKNELIFRLQELQSNEMAICQKLEATQYLNSVESYISRTDESEKDPLTEWLLKTGYSSEIGSLKPMSEVNL